MVRPRLLLLDVNETVSDLGPMADRFTDVGVPADRATDVAAAWFAAVLRDGIALAATDGEAPFAEIGAAVARRTLAARRPASDLAPDLDRAVDHVLAGFGALPVHPDVGPGLVALAEQGLRVATLSNGAVSVAEGLLGRHDLTHLVERTLSVTDAGVWKPAAAAYRWACAELDVEPAEAMLVAVHPWDTHGAGRAGLQSAWVDRSGLGPFPAYFDAPTLTVDSFVGLAEALGRGQ